MMPWRCDGCNGGWEYVSKFELRKITVDADVQAVVSEFLSSIPAVLEKSLLPKFSPVTVNEPPPDMTEFCGVTPANIAAS